MTGHVLLRLFHVTTPPTENAKASISRKKVKNQLLIAIVAFLNSSPLLVRSKSDVHRMTIVMGGKLIPD
jgi:hypothetical protein